MINYGLWTQSSKKYAFNVCSICRFGTNFSAVVTLKLQIFSWRIMKPVIFNKVLDFDAVGRKGLHLSHAYDSRYSPCGSPVKLLI